MGTYLNKCWQAEFAGIDGRERMGGEYRPYVPDTLHDWKGLMSAEAIAAVNQAEQGMRALNDDPLIQERVSGLARFLLRAESVGSSKIEGLTLSTRRLAKAEAAVSLGASPGDSTASEVLGNIEAMESALRLAEKPSRVEISDLCDIHKILMDRSLKPEWGGVIRETQNWVGGNDFNPIGASFVPPPPGEVTGLLGDLVEYLDTDHHSPLVQAAVAHAQFETIHPFADGNGRIGRALIHIVLARRGMTGAFIPPVSLILATWTEGYINGLTDFRFEGAPDSLDRAEGASQWIKFFSLAMNRACADIRIYADRVAALEESWRSKVGILRSDSSANLLLEVLAGTPIITVERASGLTGRSRRATEQAVNQLNEAGVLQQVNIGRQRYRVFEAVGVFDVFTGLERSLASPAGNTASAKPNRPVPDRPFRR